MVNSPIILFGIGAQLRVVYRQLLSRYKARQVLLCDNNEDFWGRHHFGVPCISPTELSTLPSATPIIITIRQYEAVAIQLRQLGFSRISLVIYGHGSLSVEEIKELSQTTQKQLQVKTIANQWALITGASRGIGAEIVKALASKNVNIIGLARTQEALEWINTYTTERGVKSVVYPVDISDERALSSTLTQIRTQIGTPDIIYNNAGISVTEGSEQFSREPYLQSFAINTLAPLQIMRTFLPAMINRGSGNIITLTTTIDAQTHEFPYSLSKAALDKAVLDLAKQVTRSGISLSLLDPGWVQTDMGGASAPHKVKSLLPGVLLPVLTTHNCNGKYFAAQDYAQCSLKQALQRVAFLIGDVNE